MSRPGRDSDGGTFDPAARLRRVRLSAIRRLHEQAAGRDDVVDLGLGEPRFPTPDPILVAARSALDDALLGYTPNAGLPELRDAVAAALSDTSRDGVCITAGSQEALLVAMLTLVDPGDEVLIPDPGFVAYAAVVELAGGTPVTYPLPASGGFRLDPVAFRERLSPGTRAVILNSPSNPTGQVLTEEELRDVVEATEGIRDDDRGVFLLADEVYRDLYAGDAPPPSLLEVAPRHRAAIVSGLSKSMVMTGWRLGWLAGSPEMVEHAVVVHQYAVTCAPALSQQAAMAAFTADGEEARADLRERLARRRELATAYLVDRLDLPIAPPRAGFYVMADVSGHGSGAEVSERLLQGGVLVIPGTAFGDQAEDWLRISLAVEVEVLEEGLRRMAAVLEGPG